MADNRSIGRAWWLVGCGLALVSPAVAWAADEAVPVCAAPVAPTGELAAWTQPVALAAVGDVASLAGAKLEVGRAARVALLATPDVHYPLQAEHPGGSVSHGGLLAIDIPAAGTYRVALDSGAWIDLIANGAAVRSAAHGHGPDCSGIRKIVDFDLTPGRHILQVSANAAPEITVLVARKP